MKTTLWCLGKISFRRCLTQLVLLFVFLFGTDAFAQIVHKGSTTGTQGSSGAALTIAKPTGLAVNDLMVASIAMSTNNDNDMGNPSLSGWTVLSSGIYETAGTFLNNNRDRWRLAILYKVATAADVAATNFVFAMNSNVDDSVGGISAFSGVDPNNPIDVVGSLSSETDNNVSASAITTSTPHAGVLMIAAAADDVNISNWSTTSPGTLTELFDAPFNADLDLAIATAFAVKAVPGPTGSGSALYGANEPYGALMFSINEHRTITTGTIAGSPYCAGSSVTVPFTEIGTYNSGNVFTAQLSNASGSFASPIVIGTLTSVNSGSISATIPAGTSSGTGYRIRVISSNPAVTGSNNGVNITIVAPATANAGADIVRCAGDGNVVIGAGASATNNAGVVWTTNGAGSLTNATSLNGATYSPDPSDTVVTFTLTATGNTPCANATSSKTLTINEAPTASAGGSATICITDTATVTGASASNGTIVWTENGNGSITSGQGTTSPTYTPAAGDSTVTLTMTVSAAGCPNAVATFTVNVVAAPTAFAGDNMSICSDAGTFNIVGNAVATNAASVLWTTNGSGTLANAGSMTNATYTPSQADINNGNVTFTLTASANPPCADAISAKTVSISLPPTASAGGSTTICDTQTATVSGASASNGTIVWTENGAGSITAGADTLTPTYTPAAADGGNTVTLTMTVSNGVCADATATYTVNVTTSPTANAGTALTMCSDQGSINVTAGSSAANYSSVQWTSSGTGTWTDADSMTLATYTPSEADNLAGSVTITLTAVPNSPCAQAVSSKTLTIKLPPTASAGGSQTICENQTATVSGASASNGTISWTENGAGSITAGADTLTPTYTAAAGDAGNTVTLTMTVSNAPCANATATYTVEVLALPTANAGSNMSTCANSGSISITTGASATNTDGVLWTTSGDGTFTDADSLTNAMYEPGTNDIAAGTVTLTLTASGNGSCDSASSNKTLMINPIPETLGAVICQGQNGSLTATSECTFPATSALEFPSTGANSGSGTAWSSPQDIVADDNSGATITALSFFNNVTVNSQELRASNFGFAIPANATILGITATINRNRSGSGNGVVTENTVSLIKGGTVTGNNKAVGGNWSTTEIAMNYGGTSDLWGTTWTAADLNASNFGVTLSVTASISAGLLTTATANVDYISVTVSYIVGGTINWYTAEGTFLASGASFNPVGVAGSGLADTNTPGVYTYYAECSINPGCRTPTDFTINELPTVTFTGLDAAYCEDSASVTLTGNYSAGTFAGNGITSNGDGTATFNPVAAGIGQHTVTYIYTDENSCSNIAAQIVNVNANATYYQDADGDGFGNAAITQVSCMGAPAGFVANDTDCNDNDNTKNAEYEFFVDADGDGFGTGSLVFTCAVDANTPPANYSLNNTDCDDADAAKNSQFSFYIDNDEDGFGAGSLVTACAVDANTPPVGYSLNNTDCNDSDFTMHAEFAFYVDGDGDSYGAGAPVMLCAPNASTPPSGYSVSNTDCNDSNSAISPGAAEIGYNLVDDDCDGSIDEGFPPKGTTLGGAQCNATLPAIDSPLYAGLVQGAQGYQWTITTLSGPSAGQIQVLNTPLRTMKLTQLANYAFNTVYKVDVAVYYAGFLQPYLPSTCTVITPMPTTQLGNCGLTMITMNDVIYANMVPFAPGYLFRVKDPLNPGDTQDIPRPIRDLKLSMVNAFQVRYNKTYNVEIAVMNTDGTYMDFGPLCTVTTPIFPTTGVSNAQCDNGDGGAYAVPSMNTQIFADSYPGVIAYVFKLTGPGLPVAGAEVTKPLRVFTLNDFAGMGLVPGATYNVNVRLVFNDTDPVGPFGKTCSLIVPGGARMAQKPFNAVAYPNPFADNFSINIETSLNSKVSVKVYDMAGRLLEERSASVSDMKILTIGDRFPAGVYNVIVSQDEEVKSLRVVKR